MQKKNCFYITCNQYKRFRWCTRKYSSRHPLYILDWGELEGKNIRYRLLEVESTLYDWRVIESPLTEYLKVVTLMHVVKWKSRYKNLEWKTVHITKLKDWLIILLNWQPNSRFTVGSVVPDSTHESGWYFFRAKSCWKFLVQLIGSWPQAWKFKGLSLKAVLTSP